MKTFLYEWFCILFSSIYMRWKEWYVIKKYKGQTKYFLKGDLYEIGEYTYGFPKVYSYASNSKLIIGRFTDIAENVTILTGGNHHMDRISTFSFYKFTDVFSNYKKGYLQDLRGDTVIGNDVWISRNVFILPGVKIGDGAVIGASAVVVKNVPPYAIIVGNPGRIIGYRFSENQIAALNRIQWWNWSDEKINENISEITDVDIDSFIKKHLQDEIGNV